MKKLARLAYKNTEVFYNSIERPRKELGQVFAISRQILNEVKREGDQALLRYTHFFDRVDITELKVDENQLKLAGGQLSESLKSAIQKAYKNIYTFHKAQERTRSKVETVEGVLCWQKDVPIERIGIYIPNGSAPLFSTVLMLAIPAVLADCSEIVLCSPPNQNGEIDPAILYTAQLCGINTVYRVGGVQAIGGLAYGTESIPKVDKIFGPGNGFVTAAKQLIQQDGIAIDMPAGPSELLLVVDNSIDPEWVAADVLAQSEHGADSQVVVVSMSNDYLDDVENAVLSQLEKLPRKEIIEEALQNCRMVLVKEISDAFEVVNQYAPEHLMLSFKDCQLYLDQIKNAGSVFVGKYSSESAGDYMTGTNHTLPTDGNARAYSGITLSSFQKTISFQQLSQIGLDNIAAEVEALAFAEQLEGHANAVTIRSSRRKRKDKMLKRNEVEENNEV